MSEDAQQLGHVQAHAEGTVTPARPAELYDESVQAVAHVDCPLIDCLQPIGTNCSGMPLYPDGPVAHRRRIGAYRDWLAQQGG